MIVVNNLIIDNKLVNNLVIKKTGINNNNNEIWVRKINRLVCAKKSPLHTY